MRYKELTFEGRNAVLEAFRSGKTIDKLFILDGSSDGPIKTIIREAKKTDCIINFVDKERLDRLSGTNRHQGVVAIGAAYDYASVEDILANARDKGEDPFIFILDEIEDPHNLGAILRTCDAVGVDGVIIGKKRSVGLTSTVAKVSTGAIDHVKVAQVTNLTRTLDELKKMGYWAVACENERAQDYRQVDYNMPLVLVIGSEGSGISRLVKQNCDINVVLPMACHIA